MNASVLRVAAFAKRAAGGSPASASKRVEARERLVAAVRLEDLHACHQAVGAEADQLQGKPLEAAAAGAVGTGDAPAHQQRVGFEREDLVDAQVRVGGVVGRLGLA